MPPPPLIPRRCCTTVAHNKTARRDAEPFPLAFIGRDDWIRTSGPLTPSQVRYQAAPHPEFPERPRRPAEPTFVSPKPRRRTNSIPIPLAEPQSGEGGLYFLFFDVTVFVFFAGGGGGSCNSKLSGAAPATCGWRASITCRSFNPFFTDASR